MKGETSDRLSRDGQITSGNLLKMFATKRQEGILNRRAPARSAWHTRRENEAKETEASRNKSASVARKLDGKQSVVRILLPSLAASWPLGVILPLLAAARAAWTLSTLLLASPFNLKTFINF